MNNLKVYIIFVLVIFSAHSLAAKSVSVIVDVKRSSRILINGKKDARAGTMLHAGDKILIKRKAYLRILSRSGKSFIIRYKGIYRIDKNGSVIIEKSSRNGKIKSRDYYAALRNNAGFGASRAVADYSSLPVEIRKKLKDADKIKDTYFRHLTRYYILNKYGYKKLAAIEARKCLKK